MELEIYTIDQKTPFLRGIDYGRTVKKKIHAFFEDDFLQINRLRENYLSKRKALDYARDFYTVLKKYLPELAEEVAGIAKGARISLEESMLLQIRRELISWSEDCTSLAFKDPIKGNVLAQTVDLPGDVLPYSYVINYKSATKKLGDIVIWTYAGLLGYLGFNSHGLGVCINMVKSDGWKVGIPPYLLVRHLLTCSSIDDCISEIKRIPRASSRSFMIADAFSFVNVELTVNQQRVIEGENLLHCNHYLHPDFVLFDQLPSTSTSFQRTNRLNDLISRNSIITEKSALSFLQDHQNHPRSICCHNPEFISGKTVAAVVMAVEQKEARFFYGPPCENNILEVRLR